MQSIISSLLLGMEPALETCEKKAKKGGEKSPFLLLLQGLQKEGEEGGKILLNPSLIEKESPLFLFLDEVLEEIGIPLDILPEIKEIIAENEKLMDLVRNLFLAGDFDKVREVIREFVNKEGVLEGQKEAFDTKNMSKGPGKNPTWSRVKIRGETSRADFSGQEKLKSEKVLPEEKELSGKEKKENQPGKQQSNLYRREQSSFPDNATLNSIFPDGKRDREGSAREDLDRGRLNLSSFLKGAEEKPRFVSQPLEPDLSFDEEKLLNSRQPLRNFLDGGDKKRESSSNSLSGEKGETAKNPRGILGKTFEPFLASQQGGKERGKSFSQGKEREGFQFEPFQPSQRFEIRQQSPEPIRQVEIPNRAPDVFRQIVDQARMSLKNREEGTMEIKLRPEYLGGLRMRVVLEDGQLRAHFQVENHLARDILENNLTNLRDNLSREGFTFDDVDVNVQKEGTQDPQQEQWEFLQKEAGSGESKENIEESLYSILEKNQVDYRV